MLAILVCFCGKERGEGKMKSWITLLTFRMVGGVRERDREREREREGFLCSVANGNAMWFSSFCTHSIWDSFGRRLNNIIN